MGDKSKIEWTEATWNCLYGCSRVSPGCEHCYAERFVHRFAGPGQRYEGLTVLRKKGPVWTGKVKLAHDRLVVPLRWKRGRRIFVNSLSDVWHDEVPFEFICAMYGIMAMCPHHTFQLLTKRSRRMVEWYEMTSELVDPVGHCVDLAGQYLCQLPNQGSITWAEVDRIKKDALPRAAGRAWPLDNVWLGVSAEDDRSLAARAGHLLACEAVVHWISAEPLVGPLDLAPWIRAVEGCTECEWRGSYDELVAQGGHDLCPDCRKEGTMTTYYGEDERREADPRIDWVVVGGESGNQSRVMDPRWVQDIEAACDQAGVPWLFKQWGEWAPVGRGRVEVPLTDDGLMFDLPNPQEVVGTPREMMSVRGPQDSRHRLFRAIGDHWMERVGKKTAGRLLGGQTKDGYPAIA